MLHVLVQEGVDINKLCDDAQVSLDKMEDHIPELDDAKAEEIYRLCIERYSGDNLGLLIGSQYQLKNLGLLGQLLLYAGKSKNALKIAEKFIGLKTKGFANFRYAINNDTYLIEIIPDEMALIKYPNRTKTITLIALSIALRLPELVNSKKKQVSNNY